MLRLNTIYQEDCLKGLDKIDPGSIDIVVTSPPYNININYSTYKDNLTQEEYCTFLKALSHKISTALKNNGSFFLNVGAIPKNQWAPLISANQFKQDFTLQNTIHWIKTISIPEQNISVGHFKPINSQRYHNDCHEYIFHFTKQGTVPLHKENIGVPYKDPSNIKRWNNNNNKNLRDRGNVWYIPYETKNKKDAHPAAFPVQLPEMCIKDHGYTKDTLVLDPFMGSGTTAIACKRLGINYIGFEIDPFYISIAEKRLEEEKEWSQV